MLPAMMLALSLPTGWVEHPNAEVRELRADASDEHGVLQVSRFEPGQLSFVVGQPDLGAFAVEMGHRLGGTEKLWGASREGLESACALGRLGLAVFVGGQFRAMILLVTVTEAGDAAYLWTYLGPDLNAPQVEQAMRIVKSATERLPSRTSRVVARPRNEVQMRHEPRRCSSFCDRPRGGCVLHRRGRPLRGARRCAGA